MGDTTTTLLQRLFTLVNASAGPHGIYAGTADSALSMLDADGIAIFEYDEIHSVFSIATARNLSLSAQVQTMQALTRRAASNPDLLMTPQIMADWDEVLIAEDDVPAMPVGGLLTVPLRTSKGDLLGLMAALYRDPDALTGRRQVLASLLGGLASMSLENAHLYEAERRRSEFLTRVLRIGDVMQVDQSLDAVARQIVEIIADTLGWQTVVLVLVDFEAAVRRLVEWKTDDRAFAAQLEQASGQAILTTYDDLPWRQAEFRVSRSYYVDHRLPGAADVIEQIRQGSFLMRIGPLDPDLPPDLQWHSHDFLIVPLLYRGIDLGWISVDSPRDHGRPTLSGIQQLEVFAEQLAQAIINTRLYNEAEHERLKLTTVLDGITDGVLAFDTQSRLMFSNLAAEQLLGMTLPRLPGFALEDVLAESPLLPLLQQIAPDEAYTGELEMTGTRRILQTTISPLAYMGRVVLMRDITYFREMERMRLELLSSLSHDLRNPLTTINVTTALLERSGSLNPQQRDYVDRLRSTAQRAVTMIGDLLDMARLESGARLPQDPCLLGDMIDDVCSELAVLAEQKSLTLACETDSVPVIRGDSIRLRQVLVNLIGNAIKYTPSGGQVGITAGADEQEVIVCVRDTGLGIAPVHLPYIFDRFYRVNPRANADGIGLGLAIVKTVIERHGGRIWVDSVEGEGSAFYFALPLTLSL